MMKKRAEFINVLRGAKKKRNTTIQEIALFAIRNWLKFTIEIHPISGIFLDNYKTASCLKNNK